MDYDVEGLLNVATSLIDRTRKDYIKGGKIFYSIFKRMPKDLKEVNEFVWTNKKKLKETFKDWEIHALRDFYDSYRFILEDPYELFRGRIKSEEIINMLNIDTMVDYYKDSYISGAIEAYKNGIKDLNKATTKVLKDKISDNALYKGFIKAKNEVKKLGKSDIFELWNESAAHRVRDLRKKYKLSNEED